MTLVELKVRSEQPITAPLRRDLRHLDAPGNNVVTVFVSHGGYVEIDEPLMIEYDLISTPSVCMPSLGAWADERPRRHLALVNDMDIGKPMSLASAAERGRQMAAKIADDLVDIDL